ncbi:hypothetical protein MRX96_026286 [Rhipicephalus microplus]
MYPNVGLYHPTGNPYYGQQMSAYGYAPRLNSVWCRGRTFQLLDAIRTVPQVGRGRMDRVRNRYSVVTRRSAAFGSGDGVGVQVDHFSRLDRFAYALTILSVCAVAGLLVGAALIGRHMLILGEWTESNTNAPLGLMDMEFQALVANSHQ